MKTINFTHGSQYLPVAVLCALMLNATSAASATFITSKVNGDDQFKIYLSPVDPTTSPLPFQPEGFQYANGFGWDFTFTNTLLLPQTSAGTNYKDYWLNIWVQDVGGGGPDLLGDFQLTGVPGVTGGGSVAGCAFDNGLTRILTNTGRWRVTKPLPLSSAPSPAGYPIWVSNYLPPWVAPTLVPTSLGLNGVAPWGPQPGIHPNARWITTTPANANNTEAWFSTHIRCP